MENLDLTKHGPGAFEGKAVAWNGGDYEVGPHDATGRQRIVHKLINRKSGLCMHVLKVWRHEELGCLPNEARRVLMETDVPVSVPISIEIELPGGRAELQEYIGNYENPGSPTCEVFDQFSEVVKTDVGRAATLLEQIVELNPRHSVALHNLALVNLQRGDLDRALSYAAQAVSIEPNILAHHETFVECAGEEGVLRAALQGYQCAQRMFPGVHDMDALGAQSYLSCGEPEEALECIKTCLLNPSEKQRLTRAAETALASKTLARGLMEEAATTLHLFERRRQPGPEDLRRAAKLLERAHAAYDRCPIVAINLGLTLQRAGSPDRAAQFLAWASTMVAPPLDKLCYANMAFCSISAGSISKAIPFLTLVIGLLTDQKRRGLGVSIWDVPCKAFWVLPDGASFESIPESYQELDAALKEYSQAHQVPTAILQLLELYKAAADAYSRKDLPPMPPRSTA